MSSEWCVCLIADLSLTYSFFPSYSLNPLSSKSVSFGEHPKEETAILESIDRLILRSDRSTKIEVHLDCDEKETVGQTV